jgi:hypothetical protein
VPGKSTATKSETVNAMAALVMESMVTCPACAHTQVERMPVDACQYFYECKGCGVLLKPKLGDCCVFCSYGTVKCPPKQTGDVECGCTP